MTRSFKSLNDDQVLDIVMNGSELEFPDFHNMYPNRSFGRKERCKNIMIAHLFPKVQMMSQMAAIVTLHREKKICKPFLIVIAHEKKNICKIFR